MDLVLKICDDYVFDKVWAHLVPLSAFTSPEFTSSQGGITNASSIISLVSTNSKWSQLISSLPHPPLPELTSSSILNSSSQNISAWPRDYIPRQLLSLIVITVIGIHLLYFIFAGLSYTFIFNHDMMRHPRFLKNQIKLEIMCSLQSFPGMTALTLPWFQAEVMGYSKMYDDVGKYGWTYFVLSVPL
jgi:Delta7-sterol 5-desaturase